MTQFLIVRHGETLWNREHRIQGQGNSELSPVGLRQAIAAAQRLAPAGCVRLVSSDLGRTVQTAEPIAKATGLRLETDSGLRERAFGVFEGSTADQIREHHPEEHARWQARVPDFVIPGGESLLQQQTRVRTCLDGLAAEAAAGSNGNVRKLIIVTHGGVLDALYRIAAGAALDAPRTWQLLNASINQITIDAHGWHVGRWGDISHLPAAEDDFG